ncbi:MAG: iron(III) transport system substrate-binding protein [Cryomorphaceae bacterium]|jgi:iron(III) transport system substrate-binding protein
MKYSVAVLCLFLSVSSNAANQEVNLYSARKEALIKPLLQAFTLNTGIKVNIISSKADALLKRIQAEGINSPADVLLTTDAGRLHRAKAAGVLSAGDSEILRNNIPANLRDPDNQWFGLSVRVRPIMVNDASLLSKISSYEDLTKKQFAKQICVRSSGNIYNQSLVAAMLSAVGEAGTEAWAEGLVANFARKPQGGDRDQIRASAAGQCSIVLANTYYLAQMLANSENSADVDAANKMTVIWPNQTGRGAHINVSGAGIAKHAPNRANALTLIEFLSSEEGQEIYANVNYEYPVKEGIKTNEILTSWGDFKRDDLNLSKLGTLNANAVKLMDRAGWK